MNGKEHKDLVQVHTFSTTRKALVAGFLLGCVFFFFNQAFGDRIELMLAVLGLGIEARAKTIHFVGSHTEAARQSFLPQRRRCQTLKIYQCDSCSEVSRGRSRAVGGSEIRGAWLLGDTRRRCMDQWNYAGACGRWPLCRPFLH